MKYVIVLASGIADAPIESLGGKTPLQAAHKPALDELACTGKTGAVKTIPDDLPACEEVAILSALGYDPHKYFTGEGGLGAGDTSYRYADSFAFRFNLVTEDNGILVDHAAGQITRREAEPIIDSLRGALGRPDIEFHIGRGFSGIARIPTSDWKKPECVAPEEALGKPIDRNLPHGEGSELPLKVMALSREVFREHEVNRVRADLGENPATLLWLWGPGTPPNLPSFKSLYGLKGGMVAALESARGLGRLAEMEVPTVAGATGGYRTDYAAKARATLAVLESADLAVMHIASPADASLEGNIKRKVALIEDIDALALSPVLQYARKRGDIRLMFLATHAAHVCTRKRTRESCPVAIFGPGLDPLRRNPFSEANAETAEIDVRQGSGLLPYFLRA